MTHQTHSATKTARRTAFSCAALALVLALCASVAGGQVPVDAVAVAPAVDIALQGIALQGRVTGGEKPLVAALVYAYDVGKLHFEKARTDDAGRFLFQALPAGLYKVIAIKDGFLPAVEVIRRWRDEGSQQLDLRLAPADEDDPRQAETFWAVRSRVPGDVLRDASGVFAGEMFASSQNLDATSLDIEGFEARMSALGGVAGVPDGYSGRLAGADLGLRGKVAGVDIGIEGSYQQLSAQRSDLVDAGSIAARQAVAVAVDAGNDNKLRMTSATGEMSAIGDGTLRPVDLQHHHVEWSGPSGNAGRVGVSASLTEESNYFQPGWVDLADVPTSSRLLDVTGHYSLDLGETASLDAGVRYREQTGESFGNGAALGDQSIDIFGSAGAQLEPRVLVEVGLYSKVRDGSMSLMPQGTFVVDLGKQWQASASVAQRFERAEEGALLAPTFYTAHFTDRSACQTAGEACYEVFFSRGDDYDQGKLSIGAIHRKYAETLRLTFSRDFFDRLESLFLVRGDELPEVQLSWARRVAPKVLARLQSNYAEGGGGLVYAADDQSYENSIRYLVTSIDTQFERTSTGLFVAFHHLEQTLMPVTGGAEPGTVATELELERLQLMLTQDLDILRSLPTNWAVRVNMELSRGSTPYTLEPDELIKTLTGGIAVSF